MPGSQKLVLVALLVVFTPNVCLAYLDPGSGAILWQVIAAVFIGAAVYAKKIVTVLKTVFKKKP